MKKDRVRFDVCKADILTVSYARQLKFKKRLEKNTKNIVIIPRKNLIERNVKKNIITSDANVEILSFSSDRILKFQDDKNLDNHHSNHANSIITIVSEFNKIGVDIIRITKIMEEMAKIHAKLKKYYKFKYQITF